MASTASTIPISVRVHPTAIVENNVQIGDGTAVWDNAHIRHSSKLGEQCIVGEKSYIAPGVIIGNRVKINAFVYICSAVTIEDGVMLSAGTIFTNDRYPRATTPDLKQLRGSEPDEHTLPTIVRRRCNDRCWLPYWVRSGSGRICDGRHGIDRYQVGSRFHSRGRRSRSADRLCLPVRRASSPYRERLSHERRPIRLLCVPDEI